MAILGLLASMIFWVSVALQSAFGLDSLHV